MMVLGLRGDSFSGKTTVARFLRELAGGGHDIEFSDIVCEVASDWLHQIEKRPLIAEINWEWVRSLTFTVQRILKVSLDPDELVNQAQQLGIKVHQPLYDYLEQAVGDQFSWPPRLSRANKHEHKKVLMWLGAAVRQCTHDGVWADEMDRRLTALEEQGIEFATVSGVRYQEDASVVWKRWGKIIEVIKPETGEHPVNAYETERAQDSWPADVAIVNDVPALPPLQKAVELFWTEFTGADRKFKKPRWRRLYVVSELFPSAQE